MAIKRFTNVYSVAGDPGAATRKLGTSAVQLLADLGRILK
jgi:hypothetical protein